jgi:prepilin-type N-terminal cleavage/methylation domain-containing protein
MKCLRKRSGFTLIELLVVILILAILMAIALPLYLRAVRDSERQTCRSNMQTIAVACQAYKVRNPVHLYPGDPGSGGGALDLSLLVNANPSRTLMGRSLSAASATMAGASALLLVSTISLGPMAPASPRAWTPSRQHCDS